MKRTSTQINTLVVMLVMLAPSVSAEELEAFTEPYHRIAVPASEVGVISEITVREGDEVSRKQVLARLDDEVLQASLEVARAAKDALGSRQSAEAELLIRKKQLAIYHELRDRGNASQRELERAETEYQQASSRFQSVREELDVRRLEFERVKAQIKQRVIESPVDGYVVVIEKEAGEFVSPTDPIVMQIVHLMKLKAVFSVPLTVARTLKVGQTVELAIGYENLTAQGVIEFVSPVANAESGTVAVKISLPNDDNSIPSGVVCRWNMNTETPKTRSARKRPSLIH